MRAWELMWCILTITSRHNHWIFSSSLRWTDRKNARQLLQPVAASPNREHIHESRMGYVRYQRHGCNHHPQGPAPLSASLSISPFCHTNVHTHIHTSMDNRPTGYRTKKFNNIFRSPVEFPKNRSGAAMTLHHCRTVWGTCIVVSVTGCAGMSEEIIE